MGETPDSARSGPSSVTGADTTDLCGICFCEIHPADNPRGVLNSCSHRFCFYCITTWAKDTNVCPHCKARFTRITMKTENGEETVVKVRRKNYKAWEDASDDDDEGGESDEPAGGNGGALSSSSSGTLPPVCRECGLAQNAARLIFCDRHSCNYVAHLDCIGMSEAPQTFVCDRCRNPSSDARSVEADARIARQLELEFRNMDQQQQQQQQVAQPSVVQQPPVSRSLVGPPLAVAAPSAPRAAVAPTQQDADDDVPYYLKAHAAQADIARQQLQSRLDSTAYNSALRKQQQSQKRQQATTAAATPQPAASESNGNRKRGRDAKEVEKAAAQVETPEEKERRLLRLYLHEQLPVVRRKMNIDRNQLRISTMGGHIVASTPSRVEELHFEEQVHAAALAEAKRMVDERMRDVRVALRRRAEAEVRRKAEHEARALARLAEIIALSRRRAMMMSAAAANTVKEAVASPKQEVVEPLVFVKPEPKW